MIIIDYDSYNTDYYTEHLCKNAPLCFCVLIIFRTFIYKFAGGFFSCWVAARISNQTMGAELDTLLRQFIIQL